MPKTFTWFVQAKKHKRKTNTGSPKNSDSKCPRVEMPEMQAAAAINLPVGGADNVLTVTLNAIMDMINSLGAKIDNNFKTL